MAGRRLAAAKLLAILLAVVVVGGAFFAWKAPTPQSPGRQLYPRPRC